MFKKNIITLLVCSLVFAGTLWGGRVKKPPKVEDQVLFFPTHAHLNATRDAWVAPIHGWVFEPEKNSVSRRAALKALAKALTLSTHELETPAFAERARLFLVDNERGKRLTIRLGRKIHLLKRSRPDGHIEDSLRIPVAEMKKILEEQNPANGVIHFETLPRGADKRVFKGEIWLLEPEGLTVVSDIDDTIKISQVWDKKELLANTFLRSYQAVPEMAKIYKFWESTQATFYYVSASPWQLQPSLAAFLKDEAFPRGLLHLRHWRWKDKTFWDFMKSPEVYKRAAIEQLMNDFPLRKFVLVGDSGEKDPEVYGDLARLHPNRVEQIIIRVPNGPMAPERTAQAFRKLPPDLWRVLEKPEDLIVFQDERRETK